MLVTLKRRGHVEVRLPAAAGLVDRIKRVDALAKDEAGSHRLRQTQLLGDGRARKSEVLSVLDERASADSFCDRAF